MNTLVALVLLGVGQIIVDDFPVLVSSPSTLEFRASPTPEQRWCYVHNHWVLARRWTNGLGETRFTKVGDVTPAQRPYWHRNSVGYEQWGPVYYNSTPRAVPTYRSNYVMGGGTWGTWTNFRQPTYNYRPAQTYYGARTYNAPRYGACPGGVCR